MGISNLQMQCLPLELLAGAHHGPTLEVDDPTAAPFLFPTRTLVALLEKIGFEVVHCSRPWKLVPLGLAAYQLGNRIGWRLPTPQLLNRLAVPINLADTMQLIARKG